MRARHRRYESIAALMFVAAPLVGPGCLLDRYDTSLGARIEGGFGGTAGSPPSGTGNHEAGQSGAHFGGELGSGGQTAVSGAAGTGESGSGIGGAPSSADGGMAGTVDNTSGSGPGGAVGDTAGSGTGGTGGAGGGETGTSPEDGPIRGRVIDFLGLPVAGADVGLRVEGVATVSGRNGEFEFDSAPSTYDLYVTFEVEMFTRFERFTWVYQGLTRRDPTVQVYLGNTAHAGRLEASSPGTTFGESQQSWIAIGTEHGGSAFELSRTPFVTSTEWYGPPSTSATAHALRWELDPDGFPIAYQGYDERSIDLSADSSMVASLPIAFTPPVPSETLRATVNSASDSPLTWSAHLMFQSGAELALVQVVNDSESFEVVTPQLPLSSVTVAVSQGDPFLDEPFVLAHANTSSGTLEEELALPIAPVLGTPLDGSSAVGPATSFRWASDSKVFLVRFEDSEVFQELYVLTSAKELNIPEIAGAFPLRTGAVHRWSVQVHGDWESVDEAAGPEGFQDLFGRSTSLPEGKRREAGTLAHSEQRYFTVRP